MKALMIFGVLTLLAGFACLYSDDVRIADFGISAMMAGALIIAASPFVAVLLGWPLS